MTDAAFVAGVCPQTVSDWVAAGHIGAVFAGHKRTKRREVSVAELRAALVALGRLDPEPPRAIKREARPW